MLKQLTRSIAVAALLTCTSSYADTDALTAEQLAFIDELVVEHGFEREKLTALLSQTEPNQEILEAIQRPWEAKPWHQYHPIFLTEKRLAAGLKFWQEHAETLARAEQQFGVPAEVIVAIIGVETFYGSYLGKYKVLDALSTLGFHYPPRQTFFRSELKEFLLLTRAEKLSPTELKGSYSKRHGIRPVHFVIVPSLCHRF